MFMGVCIRFNGQIYFDRIRIKVIVYHIFNGIGTRRLFLACGSVNLVKSFRSAACLNGLNGSVYLSRGDGIDCR